MEKSKKENYFIVLLCLGILLSFFSSYSYAAWGWGKIGGSGCNPSAYGYSTGNTALTSSGGCSITHSSGSSNLVLFPSYSLNLADNGKTFNLTTSDSVRLGWWGYGSYSYSVDLYRANGTTLIRNIATGNTSAKTWANVWAYIRESDFNGTSSEVFVLKWTGANTNQSFKINGTNKKATVDLLYLDDWVPSEESDLVRCFATNNESNVFSEVQFENKTNNGSIIHSDLTSTFATYKAPLVAEGAEVSTEIRCRVKDLGGLWSDWSAYKKVSSKLRPQVSLNDETVDADGTVMSLGDCNPTRLTTTIKSYYWSGGIGLAGAPDITKPSLTYPDNDFEPMIRCQIVDSDLIYSNEASKYLKFNSRPVASLGNAQRVSPNSSVPLSCVGNDTGSISEYQWKLESAAINDGVLISALNGKNQTVFIPEEITESPVYVSCRVKDNDGFWSEWAQKDLNINFPPVAQITETPIFVPEGKIFYLNGGTSYDSSLDPSGVRGVASYHWSQVSGFNVGLSPLNSDKPSFTPPVGLSDSESKLNFDFYVIDKEGLTSDVIGKELRVSRAPYADELILESTNRDFLFLHEGETNEIEVFAYDDDIQFGDSITYQWTVTYISGDENRITTSDLTNKKISYTSLPVTQRSEYLLSVTVTDITGLSVTKQRKVTINKLPTFDIIDLGNNQGLIDEQQKLKLQIQNLNDVDSGGINRIEWSVVEGGISVENVVFLNENFELDIKDLTERDVINIRVTIIDNDAGSVTKDFWITVNALPEIGLTVPFPTRSDGVYYVNSPQIVLMETGAWDNLTNDPATEAGTFDVDGNIVDIQWNMTSTHPSPVSESGSLYFDGTTPLYTGPRYLSVDLPIPSEQYIWEVTVEDNDGAKVTKSVSIYVNDAPTFNVKGSAISLRNAAEGFLEMQGVQDLDGTIQSYNWIQIGGPAVVFDNSQSPTTGFRSISKLEGTGSKTYIFKAEVTDDLGAITSKNISVTATDVFYGCGDITTDPNNPPGGACKFDAGLNHGAIIVDTCQDQSNNIWIPTSLDVPTKRSQLLAECTERHEFECKQCIPEPIADRYVKCQLLPYMMPPKKQAYTINGNGDVVTTSSAPPGSAFGEPINSLENNPDSRFALWGAKDNAEYESIFLDKKTYPATRCLDVTDHRIYANNDPTQISFIVEPDADKNATVKPLDTLPCWNWDLMYRCIEPPVNTCSDWEDPNGIPGNLNNVPANWSLKGMTDVVVDNYLYQLHKPTGLQPQNNVNGIPQDAVLNVMNHYVTAERWQIECRNELTGEVNQTISNTFCEKNPDGTTNFLRCSPSTTKEIINLGAMALDENDEPVDAGDNPYFKCLHQNSRPSNGCEYDYVRTMVDSLNALKHYELNKKSQISYEAANLLALPMCAEDPNGTGAAIFEINDSPFSFSADWDDPATSESDDCWEWSSKWLFYSGAQFQWCTLNCSDGSTGVQQELVGCGLIDESADPIPEWEQWGVGWSQCVEPLIKTICPADATIDITKNGAPATQEEIDAMDCSNPIGTQKLTETGELISSETAQNCTDPNAAILTCIPDPNCTLQSVSPAGLENGLYTQQLQEYVCQKQRNVCEKLVQVEECQPDDDFLVVEEEESSFDKAAQAASIVDSVAGNTVYENGELKIFQGSSVKCTYWTQEAVLLYGIISSVLTGVLTYATGGTGAYLVAGVGAAELLGSQEFLNQTMKCCDREPAVVEKKVSMDSPITVLVNSILGSEQQSKVPVCKGKEIRLAYGRVMDRYNNKIISGVSDGYYYEGSAFIKKPFGSLGSFNDMKITHPLNPFDYLVLIKAQEWCLFDNVIARIIQIGARDQLKDLAVASATNASFGAVKKSIGFNFIGTSNSDYGWKNVDVINKNKIMVYQWSPECKTPEGHERAQKGEILCPIDPEQIWTAYCSSDTCDETQLKGSQVGPQDDWNPKRSIKGNWDIQQVHIEDESVYALTQFVVKQGTCSITSEVCNWDIYAWPAGGASTSVSFDMKNAVYADPKNFNDKYTSDEKGPVSGWSGIYNTRKHEINFLQYRPGEPFPSDIQIRIRDWDATTVNEQILTVPLMITSVAGFDIPGTNMKLYGGCTKASLTCEWTVQVPVTVSAIPESSCRGLTVDELMLIDFTQISFDEYAEALAAKVESTVLDPQALKDLADIAISNFTDDVQNGKIRETTDATDIGMLSYTNFVGPQIDTMRFNQQLPYNLGYVDELDIDWGDGTVDTAVRFNSMDKTWENRRDLAVSEHDNICIPGFNTYLSDMSVAETEMNNKWAAFQSCVNNGNSGPVYTKADLTDKSISQCSSDYSLYEIAEAEYNKYSCGELSDAWSKLQYCVNSNGANAIFEDEVDYNFANSYGCANLYVQFNDLLNNGTSKESCGIKGYEETASYTACVSKKVNTINRYNSYHAHYLDMLNNGIAVIEAEHLWPSYSGSDKREHLINVTAKSYSTPGDPASGVANSQTFTGKVFNWPGALGSGVGTHNVRAYLPGPSRETGNVNLNSSYTGHEAPDVHESGARDTLIKP